MTSIDNKVRVSNISQLIDDGIIKTLFTFIGPVSKIHLYAAVPPTMDQLKECQIEFENVEDAKLAVHLTGTQLGDRSILVLPDSSPIIESPASDLEASVSNLPSAAASSGVRRDTLLPDDSVSVVTGSRADVAQNTDITKRVYVSGFNGSSRVRSEDLKQFFIACGNLASVTISPDRMFALLEFTSDFGAKAALKLNGYKIMGYRLHISPVNENDQPLIEPPVIVKTEEGQHDSMDIVKEPLSIDRRDERSRSREREQRRRSRSPHGRDYHRRSRHSSRSRSRDRYHRSSHRSRSRSRSRTRHDKRSRY